MRRLLVTVLALISVGAIVVKVSPLDRDTYVGSQSCASCHGSAVAAWKDSEHTRMMRPVEQPGMVVADFSRSGPGRRFEGETLLPGVWLKGVGKWDFKGWDGWEVPVPLRRCHGCHTVGLDVKTGRFVEPNIGCESCHGPGGWHVKTLGFGRIHSSEDAQLCGQCHVRGRSPSGEHFFPTGYRPGDRLADYFKETAACGASSGVGCVGCHMPKVVQIGGAFQLHTHRPGVIQPAEGAALQMPSSCQNSGCHVDQSVDWAQAAFDRHYPRPIQSAKASGK